MKIILFTIINKTQNTQETSKNYRLCENKINNTNETLNL